MSKVISILGKKGHGKDYISELIAEKLKNEFNVEIKRLAFADRLKEMLNLLTGIELGLFYSQVFKNKYMINLRNFEVSEIDYRVSTVSSKSFNEDLFKQFDVWISIRELLQYFGTDIMQKAFGKQVWINATLKGIEENKINIFTDTRFISEYKALKSEDAFTVRIHNPFVHSNDYHPSEIELDGYPADFQIINAWNPDIDNSEQLNTQIDLLITQLKEEWK